MNYLATAEAFLRELGTAQEAQKAQEAPLNALNTLNAHPNGRNNSPKWKRGDRREVAHLSTPEQAAIIARMIQTGAVLVLEGEDGTLYRAHLDGAVLPEEAAGLPRYELALHPRNELKGA